jgi:hypothetical protein
MPADDKIVRNATSVRRCIFEHNSAYITDIVAYWGDAEARNAN